MCAAPQREMCAAPRMAMMSKKAPAQNNSGGMFSKLFGGFGGGSVAKAPK